MEAEFWHERWSRGEIGFHQHDYNEFMQAFIHRLGLPEKGRLLVPLCGKSLDMLWLSQAGFHVTGVELSRQAIEDFFRENNIQAQLETRGSITWFLHGNLRIVCMDFFDVADLDIAPPDGVYDRASLVALPPRMRLRYAETLLSMLPPGCGILLITLDYPQHEMNGPPFSVSREEVDRLYGLHCSIEEIHTEDCLEREPRFRKKGLSRLTEHVFLLRKNPGNPG
jgi:thiopurine S-methyltransferase